MLLNPLRHRPETIAANGNASAYQQLQELMQVLQQRDLPEDVVAMINQEIDALNARPETDANVQKAAKAAQRKILKTIEQRLKLVPRNYYRKLWLVLGMSTFGLPLGVAFGLSLKNMGLIGIGLPIGMGIGVAVGTGMDSKALREGRQLDFEARP